MQQAAIVGVIECARDGLKNRVHLVDRHPVLVTLFHQPGRVGALDVVHRDPELTVEFTTIVDADDVRVPQRGGEIGLPVEPFAKLAVRGDGLGEDFDHIAARQPGMQSQIDLGHPAGAQRSQDGVARE